jgi:hypothetical protein
MRFFPFASLALSGALAAPTAAQTASQPNMVLTILAGVVTGHDLWIIDKQPLCLLGAGGACSGNYDTLRLSRSISPSLALGAAATYFPWPHVGFHAEVSYLGLPMDDGCIGPVTYQPDADNRAQQMCDNLGGQAGSGGAISLFVGVTLRAATRRAFSPYVRGSVGMVNLSRSTVEVIGAYVDGTGPQERQVIFDQSPRRRTPMFGAAAGFTSPLGTGYQFRLEVRDVMTSLERVTGPANDLAISPVATSFYHHFALILGFDVVLERKRGRRY